MAQKLEELPLYPLNAVLFPHAQIMLHVQDDRHREMIQWCLNNDSKFGVVLARGDNLVDPPDPYLIGTAARIVSVETHGTGSMQVSVEGDKRFRVREIDESRPYMVGRVEALEEQEPDPTPRFHALTFRARECIQEYIETVFQTYDVKVSQIKLPQDATALSFLIANLLQTGNLNKQRLLETTDTLERLAEMIPLLEEMSERQNPRITLTQLQATDLINEVSRN